MSHPDEGLIHAWLDGELDAVESARIESLVQNDPAWAAAVAEARGFIAATSRIVSALDDVPAGVIPAAPAAPAVPVRAPGATKSNVVPMATARRSTPWWALRAAAVLVVVAGTVVVMRNGNPEVIPELAKTSADLKDSGPTSLPVPAPAPAPLPAASAPAALAEASPPPTPQARNDALARRSATSEADAGRQLAAEGKAKEVEAAKLSVGGAAASAPASATAPAAAPAPSAAQASALGALPPAAAGAGATRIAKSVTTAQAPAVERRALGFATTAADQAAQPEQCFREMIPAGARDSAVVHRVTVGADASARLSDERSREPVREPLRARARTEASANLAGTTSATMQVRGDTLVIERTGSATVRALRVSCPSP